MTQNTDPSSTAGPRPLAPAPVARLAAEWLREVLDAEGAPAHAIERAALPTEPAAASADPPRASLAADALLPDPFGVSARYAQGDVDSALWYREWHREWRRFQVADRFQRYLEALGEAGDPDAVYRALAEHAVRIVGGYTCLLFPPREGEELRPVPNPMLRIDAGRLTLPAPFEEPGLIQRDEALQASEGPLAPFALLFSQERVVSLAHAPFGDGGMIVLVERRHERVFREDDWELLRLLSIQATAALRRVRVGTHVPAMRDLRVVSALLDGSRLRPVVEHALAIVARGEPLALTGVCLDGVDIVAAEDGDAAADRVRRTASEVLRELTGTLGIAVERGPDDFVLVLPRLAAHQAEGLVARLERQLPARVRVRAGAIQLQGGTAGPDEVLRALDQAVSGERTAHPAG